MFQYFIRNFKGKNVNFHEPRPSLNMNLFLRLTTTIWLGIFAALIATSQGHSQEKVNSFRSNTNAQWRNYSGALVPWAYWAKPSGKARRNIFVSYAEGSPSIMSLFVDCSTKSLATLNGRFHYLDFSEPLKWSQYPITTGWGQIIRDICDPSIPSPPASAIDNIPIISAKTMEKTPFRLSGKLIYPSDYIPAMTICAVSIDENARYCTKIKENTTQYSLFVPSGRYIVYNESYSDKTWATEDFNCSGSPVTNNSTEDWEKPVRIRIFQVESDMKNVCPSDYYSAEYQLIFPIPVAATDL